MAWFVFSASKETTFEVDTTSIILKELRIDNRKLYLCLPQKQKKIQLTCSTAVFQNKFVLYHIKSNIYISKTKFPSHKQHLYSLVSSRNAKKVRTDHSIIHLFYSVWKETTHKPLKIEATKKSFSSLFLIGTNFFDEWFLFCVITGRHFFS